MEDIKMKNRLLWTLCITILVLSYTNVKVYAAQIEQPVAGITTVLDKVNQLEIDMNKYMWTKDTVNMRKEASTNSDIITKIDKRAKVPTISSSDGWTKIKYDESFGFVKTEYLRDTELPSLDFTDEEIELIAKIVWLESRGESDLGESCVVSVIINRVISKDFSDNVTEVLSDRNEFSTWKLLDTAKPTEREYEIVKETLNGEWNKLDEDYIYFSTSPRNNNGTVKIGNHFFCKED
jgi:spore germination cell wall hydrolase CwlJ-like protein